MTIRRRAMSGLLAVVLAGLELSCATPLPPSDCGTEGADTCRVDTLEVDGQTRTYVVSNRYPPDCTAGPVPLLLFFHGSASRGIDARTDFAFFEDALAGRARIVYPDGLPRSELGGTNGWNRAPDGDDVHFVDALLAALQTDSCVDPARAFAVGHSRGGRFTEVLGCFRAGAFRGFAESSGGTDNVQSCPGQAPFLIAHARDDQGVPYAEGEAMRDRWASRNGCTPPVDGYAIGTCTALSCPPEHPVSFCPYEGETWKGHFPPPFFGTAVWEFFKGL